MAKPRKKYNPRKSRTNVDKYLLKNIILTLNKRDNDKTIAMLRDGSKTLDPLPLNYFKAIQNTRHNWLMYLACVRLEKNGKQRLVVVPAPAPFEVYHTQINDSLDEAHDQMIRDELALGNEILNTGWIAVPNGVPIEEEELDRLFQDVIGL